MSSPKKTSRLPELDFVLELRSLHRPGSLGKLFTAVGAEGGLIGDISTKFVGKSHSVREVTISVFDREHLERVKAAIAEKAQAVVLQVMDPVFDRHQGGKIHSRRRADVRTVTDLRYIYTPGVARVCKVIQEDKAAAREYTGIANSVGIFTNGTRVLGLGDIGVLASMPVMEGKAVIYDQFVGISATPILVDTKDPDDFIRVVERVAPTFGGIHLEDIRMPDCFYIESELIRRLRKPVMHDDQHGTATVTLAAVISAMRITGLKTGKRVCVAQLGLGAAGFGIARLLMDFGLNVAGVDPNEGSRKRLVDYGGKVTTLEKAMAQAQIVIASTGMVGLIKPGMIRKGQIILALSNPVSEIHPEEAIAAGAAFASDGKSINNALAYPGLFKAALQVDAHSISSKMKIAAARVISNLADEDELVPSPFHPEVHDRIVAAVKKAARPR